MQKEILNYLDTLKNNVKHQISMKLTVASAHAAFKDYFSGTKSTAFHAYYSEIISNKEKFLSDPDFFREFKQQYSLQGVDGDYLATLEENKSKILQLIERDEISNLYFEFFANAPIRHGEEIRQKSLGSFFAKLVHTFAPDKFCALDNPIKDYFGLGRESFYIAFIVISQAYKEWSNENSDIMGKIKMELESFAKDIPPNFDMTDLKLLDLIFWHQANPK